MKNYKASDHAKLDNEVLQSDFIDWMKKEYSGYVDGKEIAAHNDGDFDWFVSEFFKWYNQEETILSVETKGGLTWYIDYQPRRNVFNIHLDEKFKTQRKTKSGALEYIFNFITGKHFKVA